MCKKTRTTKKAVLANYQDVIVTPYCHLQKELAHHSPRYYTAGVYGWNADIYEVEHNGEIVAICTGYRPFGNSNIQDEKWGNLLAQLKQEA